MITPILFIRGGVPTRNRPEMDPGNHMGFLKITKQIKN
jgi:hypothetical protein